MMSFRPRFASIGRSLACSALVLSTLGCAPGLADAESTTPAAASVAAPSKQAKGAPITAEALYLQDELWPYRVYLTRAWAPEGGEPIRQPVGVLLRVVDSETVRVDFGHHGIYELPIDATDVVERAREIRVKGKEFTAGNLTYAVGGALGDPTSEEPAPYDRPRVALRDLLLVAAPLDPELLRAMAKPFSEIDGGEGVRVIFLAQGASRNEEIHAALRAAGWTPPYLFDRYVRSITEGSLGPNPPIPGVGLFTPNGRVLHEEAWKGRASLEALQAVLAARAEEQSASKRAITQTDAPPQG